MKARVHLLHRDCLPPHEKVHLFSKSIWWILTAVFAVGVLWTILE